MYERAVDDPRLIAEESTGSTYIVAQLRIITTRLQVLDEPGESYFERRGRTG
ncbi:hypothetical protein Pcac1_g4990 [Phytophthora cactorum]|nr:hypothetical protein Pcac1_g4990 [Phytophthora cactorum]